MRGAVTRGMKIAARGGREKGKQIEQERRICVRGEREREEREREREGGRENIGEKGMNERERERQRMCEESRGAWQDE